MKKKQKQKHAKQLDLEIQKWERAKNNGKKMHGKKMIKLYTNIKRFIGGQNTR